MTIEIENENNNLIAQRELIFLFLIFLINITPCLNTLNPKNVHKIIILFSNQITLKIDTRNDYFAQVLYDTSKTSPSEVRLNGYSENLDRGRIEVDIKVNTIILKFSSLLQNCENMFKDCDKITEIDFSSFESSEINNINNMFEGCKYLKSIDFGNFDTSKVTQMSYVFSNCLELESLDLSKFDISKVERFNFMFEFCRDLTSLDLSHFDTSSCTSVTKMFYHCDDLRSLDLTNFNTSKITEMGYMFSDCYSLASLDLSSFDTKEVENMEYMFNHCSSIYSLDLTSFNLKSITKVINMFSYCRNLNYVKIKDSFLFSVSVQYADITEETNENLLFCVEDLINSSTNTKTGCSSCSIDKSNLEFYFVKKINLCCYPSCQECEEQGNDEYHKCKTCKSNYNLEINTNNNKNCYINQCSKLFFLDSDNKINCIIELNCPEGHNKLTEDKNQCIQRCDLDNEYKYEYENKCYKKCPEETEESKTTSSLCEKKQMPVIVETTQINPIKELKSDTNYKDEEIQDIQIKENDSLNDDEIFYRKVIDNLTFAFNMSELDSKKEIIVEKNNSKYILSTSDYQKRESNESTIDLGNCETKLDVSLYSSGMSSAVE